MKTSRYCILWLAFSCAIAVAQSQDTQLSIDSRRTTLDTASDPYMLWNADDNLGLLEGSDHAIVSRKFHVQPTSPDHSAIPLRAQVHPNRQLKAGQVDVSGSLDETGIALQGALEFDALALGDGPLGTPDRYAVASGGTLSIAAPGFLANDIDLNGEPLTAVSIQDNVDHGALAAFADGSFTYTPDAGFTGTDGFSYRMRDASNNFSDPILVTIEVLPAGNRTPVGTPDAYAMLANESLSILAPGFLANDIDLDGENISAVSIQDSVDHGALSAFADGSFTYTPDTDFVGTDSFAYRMRDASNNFSDPILVTIEVFPGNRAPIGVEDHYAARINTALSIAAPGFLANDIDLDGEAISAVSIQDNVDHGALAAFADGSFTYTPDAGYTGTDSFAYRMRDASNNFSDPIVVTIEVFSNGVIPVGGADLYQVPTDQTLSMAAPGFLANDIDLNGEALTAVSINDNVDNGNLAAFADGSFTYTPDADFVGTDSFTYRMRDASNNYSDPVLVTIQVLPAANRMPIGMADAYTTLSNTSLSIAAPGFLANDIDLDGEAITAVSIQDNVDYGTLAAFADGSFIYTPDEGFAGTDSFAYRMRDASNHFSDPITVTITVFAGNRAPIGVPDHYAVLSNSVLSIAAPGFLTNDIDLDGEAITAVSIQDNVDHGTLSAFADGRFTYTPNVDFAGTDSFAYRMRDASNHFSDPVPVSITVIDPSGACVDNLAARAKAGKIQLTWTYTGAHHYNVYRSTIAGGPYLKIGATTSTYSTFLDSAVVTGTTYYYVVREADYLDLEMCQSNEASARASLR